MIRACEITDSGMRCDDDGELCIAVSNKDTWVCWEHFQDMEAPNLKVIRKKISQEIKAVAYHDNDLGMIYPNAAAIARGE
jgi:hypothetical protein